MNRAIVSAIGSRGDVNPMLSLGKELKRRGWQVIFLTSEPYLYLAQEAGLDGDAVVDAQQFQEMIDSPGMWSPFGGLRQVFSRCGQDLIPSCYSAIEKHYLPGQTVLVSHLLDFSGRIFRDRHPTTTQVSVVLAPMAIRTPTDPARLTDWWYEVRRPSTLVRWQYWIADQLFIRPWLANPINRFRAGLGLATVSRPLKEWFLSPDAILGLFPEWFAPGIDLLPPQMKCTGFLLEDTKDANRVSNEKLKQILKRFPDGQAPIVFAPGTANTQASNFFESALLACQNLKLNAIFLTEHPQQLPRSLPPNIQHHDYLPFSQLLPHVRAIVHHGGIGTTSQALAAGVVQLLVPMAFDQFDNADRVKRLKCGQSLPSRRLTSQRLTAKLESLLSDPELANQCQVIAGQINAEAALQRSVDFIESASSRLCEQ